MANTNKIQITINGDDRSGKAFATSKSNLIALEKMAKQASFAFAGFATASAVAAVHLTKQAINLADEMGKTAERAGLNVAEFTALSYAANLAGTSADDLKVAMRDLSKSGVGDLSGELIRIADRMKMAGSESERLAIATSLPGKQWQNLIPLLSQGGDALRKQMDEARKFSVVIGPEFAGNAAEFNDNLTRLKASAEGLWLRVAENVLPSLIEMSEKLVNVARDSGLAEKASRTLTGAWYTASDAAKILGHSLGEDDRKGLLSILKALNPSILIAEAALKKLEQRGRLAEMQRQLAEGIVAPQAGDGGAGLNAEGLRKYAEIREKLYGQMMTGLPALVQAENLAHQQRMTQIAELIASEQQKNGLTELASSLHQQKITEIHEQGLGARATLDELYKAANLEGLTRFMESESYAQLQNLETTRQIMKMKEELFDLSHKTELDKEAKHLQQMINLRKNWATASATALGQLASAAEAFGKKGVAAHRIFATSEVIISTSSAIMKIWEQWGWPLGAVFGAAAAAAGAAQISNINSAHGGMTNVPSEATYLLDKGERVLSPNQNSDLIEFMQRGGGGPTNITLEIDGHAIAKYVWEGTRDGSLNIHPAQFASFRR